MIEIPDPPDTRACTTCMSALTWVLSSRNWQWFSVVRVDDDTMRIHPCRDTGGWPTWRESRQPSPPNDAYRAARERLGHTEEET